MDTTNLPTERSEPLSDCCVSGSLLPGKPTGKVQNIGGLQTYVAAPPNGSKAKTVVLLTDVFGWTLNNARLLADEYAQAGLYVLIPDLFGGDCIDPQLLDNAENATNIFSKCAGFGLLMARGGPWIYNHREAVSKPILQKFMKAVKADPEIGKIGSVGFCWGGRYSFLLASENDYEDVDCSVANHPSQLVLPKEAQTVNKPLLMQVGDVDMMLSMAKIKIVQEALKGKPGCDVIVIPGAKHGFAVRPSQSDPNGKDQMAQATKGAISFFLKHLS